MHNPSLIPVYKAQQKRLLTCISVILHCDIVELHILRKGNLEGRTNMIQCDFGEQLEPLQKSSQQI